MFTNISSFRNWGLQFALRRQHLMLQSSALPTELTGDDCRIPLSRCLRAHTTDRLSAAVLRAKGFNTSRNQVAGAPVKGIRGD